MNTYQPKGRDIVRNWHVIDAKDAVLGRLSTKLVGILMGKGKPTYAPHLDAGDYVVVINAEKVKVTGNKEKQKMYYGHSGYPGGFKEVSYAKLKQTKPERIIEFCVKGMLPDNRLKSIRLKRLHVVVGERNPYEGKFNNSVKQ